MQQRQPRVGDIVDDYCPRERRLTNHAIVAMVGDDVRQVRCTTCDAEHEYKQAKVPVIRKRKEGAKAAAPAVAPAPASPGALETDETLPEAAPEAASEPATPEEETRPGHEASVHRRLIRATLPRVEGQVPARPIPEFTMHRANTPAKPFRGKGFRPGPSGGAAGPHRGGGKGSGPHARHGGPARQGGQGGSFSPRGPRGSHGPQGPRPPQGPHGGGPSRRKKP